MRERIPATIIVGGALLALLALLTACQPQAAPSPTATKPAAATATAVAVAPTKPAAATVPATTAPATTAPATGTAATSAIPQVPPSHQPIAQRQDCVSCHKDGGFMPFPANHAGRTSEICAGCHQVAAPATPPVVEMVSAKAATAPTVDGQAGDPVWANAKAVTVHVNGGINESETDVILKSVYTSDSVYFLAQYKDPTESLRRQPWVKQQDGSWKAVPGREAYEDKFAFIWNINDTIKGFNQQGCAVVCHAVTDGRDRPLKYTNADGELGDTWHVKMVRTIPVGQIDDQYLDNDTKAGEAGRKNDAKTSGGYANNSKEGATTPPFALPENKPAPPYWIMDSEKVPFDDSKYKAGDEVPGILIAPMVGDRGDIAAKAVWKDGTWTIEWSRKLQTGSKTDVQFDPTKDFYFGVAVFENAQIGHAVQYGVTKFTFAP